MKIPLEWRPLCEPWSSLHICAKTVKTRFYWKATKNFLIYLNINWQIIWQTYMWLIHSIRVERARTTSIQFEWVQLSNKWIINFMFSIIFDINRPTERFFLTIPTLFLVSFSTYLWRFKNWAITFIRGMVLARFKECEKFYLWLLWLNPENPAQLFFLLIFPNSRYVRQSFQECNPRNKNIL